MIDYTHRNRRIAVAAIVACLVLLVIVLRTANSQEISLGHEMTELQKIERVYGKRLLIWNKSQWSIVSAPRFAKSDTITVFTASLGDRERDRELATKTLLLAERYRKQIAIDWLGRELPRRRGKVTVNVALGHETRGLTWAIDTPLREYHVIYLTLASLDDLEPALAHEMVHCVLATAYARPRLPRWIEEGVACLVDRLPRPPGSEHARARCRMEQIVLQHGKRGAIEEARRNDQAD